MNTTFRTEKILLGVVGIAFIATLGLPAMVMSKSSSGVHGVQAVLPNHKSPDVSANTTNSPVVKPHFRLPGTNGPVWPPSLPVRPLTPPN